MNVIYLKHYVLKVCQREMAQAKRDHMARLYHYAMDYDATQTVLEPQDSIWAKDRKETKEG